MVIRRHTLEYICPICLREYDTLQEASRCEVKGDGKLDIVPGEVFERIADLKEEPRIYAVVFIKDMSGTEPCKNLVEHYPYWRLASLRMNPHNIKDVRFKIRPYEEINPQKFNIIPPENFEMAESYFARRRSELGLPKNVCICPGEVDHLYSVLSRCKRSLKEAIRREDYEQARKIQTKIDGLCRSKK